MNLAVASVYCTEMASKEQTVEKTVEPEVNIDFEPETGRLEEIHQSDDADEKRIFDYDSERSPFPEGMSNKI